MLASCAKASPETYSSGTLCRTSASELYVREACAVDLHSTQSILCTVLSTSAPTLAGLTPREAFEVFDQCMTGLFHGSGRLQVLA